MTSLHPIELPALDAYNPLGLLAALGLLRVLDEDAARNHSPHPMLALATETSNHAVIHSHLPFERIKDVVIEDAKAQSASVALGLAYDDHGNLCPPDRAGAVRDLKPAPQAARGYLQSAAIAARRDADLAGAFLSEFVQDGNGNAKPTALHFAAGQQSFLGMVEALRTRICRADVDEALVGPWRTQSPLPSLGWDSTVARLYALRADDPSSNKRGSVPAANWLGLVGLSYLPVYPWRGRLMTTGVDGRWKGATFRWPVWVAPSTSATLASLLRTDWRSHPTQALEAVGIAAVAACKILRSDQGGYGSFSPSVVEANRSM